MRDFHKPGRSAVFSSNGMCATSHPLAAKAAIDTMQAGGNAVDAALTAAFMLCICEPQMTGLGGDCFVLLKPANSEKMIALNGSGRAPAALDVPELRAQRHKTMPIRHVAAVTMPGAVDAFCRLSTDWGKLGLAQNLAPAIHYAEQGVPVAPRTAFDWSIAARDGFLSKHAQRFYLPKGTAPQAGDMFHAPKQAEVMRRIATHGRAGFYEGEVAQDLISSLNALGGDHTLEDLNAVACTYDDPIQGTYRGATLYEHPPNGQGATAILLANILARFDMSRLDPFGAQRLHLEAEAARLAYDARDRFIADMEFTDRMDHMLSPETADRLAGLIDPARRAQGLAAKAGENVHKDTVYLTVVDRDRMAVSLIFSIFHSFGSGLASDKFGILFQNRGAGFTLEPDHPNEAGGGKRPMHTIIPAMLNDSTGRLMPFGVMGGQFQPTGHVRVMSNMLDFGMDPQAAIDGPRSFADGDVLKVERGTDAAVLAELEAMGHMIEIPEGPLGGAQAIRIDPARGVLEGASDGRKDGCAIGY